MITFVHEPTTDPRVLVAAVSGELVAGSAPELRRRLGALTVQGPQQVVLDLSEVTFTDLAGLGPVLEARSVLVEAGGRLRLRAVPASLLALLRWTGLVVQFPEVDVPPELPSVSSTGEYAGDGRGYRNEVQSLRESLRSRQSVERAKGMLMAVHGCDPAGAWGILHGVSRAHQVRVRDLSQALTDAFTAGPSSWHASMAAALVEVVTPRSSTGSSSVVRALPGCEPAAAASSVSAVSARPAVSPDVPVPPGVSTPPRFGAGAAWPVLHEAAWSAMTHLADQAPMHLWLVTRTVGADQVMVAGAGDWTGSVSSEGPIGWLAPLCSWMRHDAAADFPAIDDPRCRVADGRAAYARVGLSLTGRAGELLGTVWGFSAGADDPPLTPVLTSLPLVQVMLSAVLVAEQALRTASGPGLPDPASR